MTAKTKLSWRYRCQKCGKLVASTRSRTIYTKLFTGPCSDSFCYASCDLEACKPISAVVCDGCETALKLRKTP